MNPILGMGFFYACNSVYEIILSYALFASVVTLAMVVYCSEPLVLALKIKSHAMNFNFYVLRHFL